MFQRASSVTSAAVRPVTKCEWGFVEWIPPPHLDSGQSRVNDYHHPENYLLPNEDDDDES
jgi:hypothetical protein